MARSVILPDAIFTKEGSIRLNEGRRRAIETEAIEHLRLNDARSIDKSRRGFESRIERCQRIMKPPCATSSVPDRLQNRAVFSLRDAVSPRMPGLELCPIELRVVEPEVGGGHARVIIPVFTGGENRAQRTCGSKVVAEPGDPEKR